jgi:hypothetical protein
MVSVLTPARRYAEPFLRRLAQESAQRPLLLRGGRGRFAQQVIAGAASEARRLGITTLVVAEQGDWRSPDLLAGWDLLSAGSFEEDLDTVRLARGLRRPPRHICTVAAGVREFGQATGDALGVHGLAQWFPGAATTPDTGPTEPDFITAYESMGSGPPDYPAVQAAVAAELAVHCCEIAESTRPEMVWPVVSRLKARTLYGWFGIDAESGFQTAHETTLVRWADGGLERVS